MIRFLQTPGRTKKIVLGGLLMVICGAMVITLIPGGILGDTFGLGNPQGNIIAKVGDQDLTVTEVQEAARQMGKQQFPRGFPQQFMPFLMQRAAQQLILQKAMMAEAHQMGFKVTDAELRDELLHGPLASTLFPGGSFVGEENYQNFVQSSFQMGVPQFEQLLKNDLLIRKLRAAVEGGVTISDQEIAQQYQRENTRVKFDYAVLTTEDLMKQVHPAEAELKTYFDQHKQQYANAVPEKRQARYVVIDTAKVRQQTPVTPQELQQYYNSHRDQYRVPEQVNVRHILIKTPAPAPDGKVDEAAVKAAREKADSVLKQVQSGAKFEDLAKKYSEDPGSKDNGGSIGWIQRGQTVPEFEQSAFSMAKGQTSGIVRSTFGFHIIHVNDKQEAHVKPLDEVKPQIEPVLAADKAASRSDALANNVQTQARAAGGLEKAAKDNGLDLVETGLFTRDDSLPGIGNAPEFMSAVFSARDKGTPDSVHVPQGYVIYQVIKVEPARAPSFDEVRARVEQEYRSDKVGQMLQQKTAELSEKARSMHDLKKAAKELGATVKTSDLVGPNSQVPDLGSLGSAQGIFDMKPGEISGPIGTGRNGAVVSLLEKQEPPAAQFAASKDRLRDQLLQKKRNEFLEVFATNLQKRMEKDGKIKINQRELKRITTPTQSTETG